MGDARVESRKRQNVRHACQMIEDETGLVVLLWGAGMVWCQNDVLIPNFRGIPFDDLDGIKQYIETEIAIMAMRDGGLGEGLPF